MQFIINPSTNRKIKFGGRTHRAISLMDRRSRQLGGLDDNQEKFFESSRRGDLEEVQRLSKLPDVHPGAAFDRAIILASQNGHLKVVEFLASLPDVNPGGQNDLALIVASDNGHFNVVKYLESLPSVNPAARDNKAIGFAVRNNDLPMVVLLANSSQVDPIETTTLDDLILKTYNLPILKFLLAIKGDSTFNPSFRHISEANRELMIKTAKKHYREKFTKDAINHPKQIKVLLAAANLISPVNFTPQEISDAKKEIKKEQVQYLLPDAWKICTSLRDISLLEQIEILDNSSKYAKNIPYHVKWEIIYKCKHFK